MTEILNFIIIFITSLIALIVLGLIAGFSPTLYIAQVAVSSKNKKRAHSYSAAIMGGVVTAIVLLIALFQVIHLDTLIAIIGTTVHAVTVSVIFNLLVGIGLIYGGNRYLKKRKSVEPSQMKLKSTKNGGIAGIFGLGFARTLVSVRGVTATFVAGNIIADVSGNILERLIYSVIFLAATVIPFVGIVLIMRKNPTLLATLTNDAKRWLNAFNYQLIVGVAVIIFGSSIIIFNLMMALFY